MLHRRGAAVRVGALLLVCCATFGLMLLPVIRAQNSQNQPGAVHGQLPGEQRPDQQDEDVQRLERERQKKADAQRYDNLKRDTDRLLQLATDLKQAVDKSNQHTMSLDVIKKAGEIEKLAKSVKEKMKAY